MKRYKSKEGIYIIELCGEHMIVSNRRLWPEVPAMQLMNGFGFMMWKMLEKGTTKEEMVRTLKIITKRDEKQLAEGIHDYVNALYKHGYLIEEEL